MRPAFQQVDGVRSDLASQLFIMAYDTKQLYQQAIQEIEANNLFFVEDVVAYLGIAKPTFYDHFPVDSNEMNDIKDRLNKNKMRTKVSIRSKLHKSTSPTGLLALYKLLATDDERRALAMEYREHSGKIEQLIMPKFVMDEKTDSEKPD